jgi:hypothetical protein
MQLELEAIVYDQIWQNRAGNNADVRAFNKSMNNRNKLTVVNVKLYNSFNYQK